METTTKRNASRPVYGAIRDGATMAVLFGALASWVGAGVATQVSGATGDAALAEAAGQAAAEAVTVHGPLVTAAIMGGAGGVVVGLSKLVRGWWHARRT